MRFLQLFKRHEDTPILVPEPIVPEEPPTLDGIRPTTLTHNPDYDGEIEVFMLRTVANTKGGWEYYANRFYRIAPEVADEWILKGYATGTLSREYSEDERIEMLSTIQVVNLGGDSRGKWPV